MARDAAQHVTPFTYGLQALENLFGKPRTRQINHPGTNEHHPAGTGGYAVAARHHQPVIHRATHK